MRELWRVPVPPSALLRSSEFVVLPRRECELRLAIGDDDGSPCLRVLRFSGVEVYKCTYMTSCTADMFNLAYGRLVALDSDWLAEIRTAGRMGQASNEALQHLMITFDDGPCYEIICRSWSVGS
jgi:hypothetical protein